MSDEKLHELHNRLCPVIVRQIVEEVRASGGGASDILVILETIMVGLIIFLEQSYGKELGTEQWIGMLTDGLDERLKEVREQNPTR